jgi:hypothetical protein
LIRASSNAVAALEMLLDDVSSIVQAHALAGIVRLADPR